MADPEDKKRRPKPTYVHGLDGERYVRNKILKNLSESQPCNAYGEYIPYKSGQRVDYSETMDEQQESLYETDGDEPTIEATLEATLEEESIAFDSPLSEEPRDTTLQFASSSSEDTSKAEYKQLLGGLFKEEAPVQQQPEERECPWGAPIGYEEKAQVKKPQAVEKPAAAVVDTIKEETFQEDFQERTFQEAIQQPEQSAPPALFRPRPESPDKGKTTLFRIPAEGVVRSSRGTVELLVHKNGRTFRPQFNAVGILLRVDVSDGFSLIKQEADKNWIMSDREGNVLAEDPIANVAFDRKGNLWYETTTLKRTKFLVDGSVEVSKIPPPEPPKQNKHPEA